MRQLRELPEFEIMRVMTPHAEKTAKVQSASSAALFGSIAEPIAACELVDVVTPTRAHHACAMQALDAGKHVFHRKADRPHIGGGPAAGDVGRNHGKEGPDLSCGTLQSRILGCTGSTERPHVHRDAPVGHPRPGRHRCERGAGPETYPRPGHHPARPGPTCGGWRASGVPVVSRTRRTSRTHASPSATAAWPTYWGEPSARRRCARAASSRRTPTSPWTC
ncbi:MAG: Gfo/Idh/MocA family oxidoreductase [Flavobacteriales bacterium]|nr:Gfo/Idh/MocA family oxidoreductase [Flavobacteriales bacterium]